MAGDTLEIVIDADRINVDGFLNLVELQQNMANPPPRLSISGTQAPASAMSE